MMRSCAALASTSTRDPAPLPRPATSSRRWALEAALAGGADFVGLVFFPPSPRNVTLAVAKALADRARGRARIVALMVDPDDALIAQVVASAAPDLIQLHGYETPTRVAEVRARWGIPVVKAVPVETAED